MISLETYLNIMPRYSVQPHVGLFKRRSTIPHAGDGVFTKCRLNKETHLGYYMGRIFWKYPKRNKRNFDYIMQISRRPPWIPRSTWESKKTNCVVVDGNNILAYFNDGDQSGQTNCRFTQSGRFVTNRCIEPGEELFVSYGEDYWNSDV